MARTFNSLFGPRRRDRQIDVAKAVLLERFFPDGGTGVYYGRQLEIELEETFFHWITKKALNELVEERRIKFEEVPLKHGATAHFYWPRRHRYPRRQIRDAQALIAEFSEPTFTEALGAYGALLADAGMARIGFRVVASNVREVDGKAWVETNHNLDRLVTRDGERYGIEIKNTLGYIDQTEFQIKLSMSAYFGIRPMFIARMMPTTYINEVWRAGGFV